ncbi:hypothetical protein ILUMI_05946 [Ignelater luminosus]|uniref:Metalloendopeptidase n=1 Tax=Ignelater luminosus TaxID=2038154 RepID=A0A8K0GFW2_IGNLU|nr:hypothetical protein ILUMI_05946 [Ignelater luminosus]
MIENKQNLWELGDETQGDLLFYGYRDPILQWKDAIIPIVFDTIYTEEQREWIMKSLMEITSRSCIKFIPPLKGERDYVFITHHKKGCSSYIGKRGGLQILNLTPSKPGTDCFQTSVIVHEFLHVLGFIHQQSVPNRDDYVHILYDNIKPGKKKDFEKHVGSGKILNEEYDFLSIMHYSPYAKSKNGEKTIIPKNSSIVLKKNTKLSKMDVEKINKAYCNKPVPTSTTQDKIVINGSRSKTRASKL